MIETVEEPGWSTGNERNVAAEIRARIDAGPEINPPDWESWSAELDRLAGDAYGREGAIKTCGADCWRSFFEDGLSPAEAIEEDMSYWGE